MISHIYQAAGFLSHSAYDSNTRIGVFISHRGCQSDHCWDMARTSGDMVETRTLRTAEASVGVVLMMVSGMLGSRERLPRPAGSEPHLIFSTAGASHCMSMQ